MSTPTTVGVAGSTQVASKKGGEDDAVQRVSGSNKQKEHRMKNAHGTLIGLTFDVFFPLGSTGKIQLLRAARRYRVPAIQVPKSNQHGSFSHAPRAVACGFLKPTAT